MCSFSCAAETNEVLRHYLLVAVVSMTEKFLLLLLNFVHSCWFLPRSPQTFTSDSVGSLLTINEQKVLSSSQVKRRNRVCSCLKEECVTAKWLQFFSLSAYSFKCSALIKTSLLSQLLSCREATSTRLPAFLNLSNSFKHSRQESFSKPSSCLTLISSQSF